MPSRKPLTPAHQPPTPSANRHAVLMGRIGKNHGSNADKAGKKYPKFIATMPTGNNNNNNNLNLTTDPSHPHPPHTGTRTPSRATRSPSNLNPTAPMMHTPTPTITTPALGRPRGSSSLDGGKYGRCPRCATGRRIRSRYNPHGHSVHRGKFRFVCSTRADLGCDYSETLDDDPALCPDLFSGKGSAAAGGGVSLGMGGGRMGRGTVLGRLGDEEEFEEEFEEELEDGVDFEIIGQSAVVSPSGGFGRRTAVATAVVRDRNQTAQNLGCPQCMVGRLTKRRKDNFRCTETMLVCEKVWDGKGHVGGCGYQIDLGTDPVEEGHAGGGVGAGTGAAVGAGAASGAPGDRRGGTGAITPAVAKAREEIRKLKKKSAREIARERKEMDEWAAKERARAMANPYAAAVMVVPNTKPKKKIVVDLTDDGEFTSMPRGPPGGSAVGAYAPIFILDDDDETPQPIKRSKPASFSNPPKPAKITKFDEFGFDDEMDLVRLAEEAANEANDDGLNREEELVLMELADKFSSPMPAK